MSDAVEGLAQMLANLRDADERARAGGAQGLGLAARNTLNVSNAQVPHEEGDLERDGAASVDEAEMRAAVAYGRTAQTAPYAIPQHERLDFKHDAGRNAKFLENAMNSTTDTNAQIIAQAIRGGLGT